MSIKIGMKLGIPYRSGSGIRTVNWTDFIAGATLTVETATPTQVKLTSASEFNATLPDKSAFILEMKTISSVALDATNKILIITVTEAYLWGEYLYLGYNKPTNNPLKLGSKQFASFMLAGTNSVAMTVEYAAVYNALTTKPNSGVALYQNKWVSDLIAGGIMSDIDSMRMLAQTVNSASEALVDWKDPTKIATLHGATPPAFTALVGFEMLKADNRYIDLLWKPSDGVNYTLNDASVFIYFVTDPDDDFGYDAGCYDGTYFSQIQRYKVQSDLPYEIWGIINGGNTLTEIIDITGLFVCNRTGANAVDVYHKGIKIGNTWAVASQAGLTTNAVWLGCRHDPADFVQNPSSRQYALVGFAKALTPTKITTLTTSFDILFNCTKYSKASTILSAFIQTDFSDSNLAALRATIRARIWPGGYPATGVDHITTGVAEPMDSSSANLASVDELTIEIAGIADRQCYVWHPTVSNGKFVIYHWDHHYGVSFEVAGRADYVRALIDEGYTVCRIPMPPSNAGVEGGSHSYPVVEAPYETVVDLHYFLDSSIRVLNEFAGSYSAYYITGLSGGAWTTTLVSALDERITKSAGGSGTLPITATVYGGSPRDWEQLLPGIDDLVDYGDLYAMGCTSGRSKIQSLIKYENHIETGFNEVTYRYAPYAVKMASIAGDRFQLIFDDTTVTHEMSAAARAIFIAFLNA